MIIREKDINQGLDPLPVRRGCGPGPCACTGRCEKIIGHIGRGKYLAFMAAYISPERFIDQNMTKVVTPPRGPNNQVGYIQVEYNNSTPMISIMALKVKRRMGESRPIDFYVDLMSSTFITDREHIDFIMRNREKFESTIKEWDGTMKIVYKDNYEQD